MTARFADVLEISLAMSVVLAVLLARKSACASPST